MNYTLSKVVKKDIPSSEVLDILAEQFRACGNVTEQDENLIISGFNRNIGGINYIATASFTVKKKEDRSIINVSVNQKTTKLFWFFLIITLIFTVIMAAIPIGFYFYGKTQVLNELERGLQSTVDEIT